MNEKLRIRNSLSKTLTIKLAALIIVALLSAGIGSYIIVSGIVHDQLAVYNTSISSVMLDSITITAAESNAPVDERFVAEVNFLGKYFCEKGFADFIYSYIVCPDKKHIILLDVAERENLGFIEQTAEEFVLEEIEYEPNELELELWEGKKTNIVLENHFLDRTTESVCAKDDNFGNRIVIGTGLSYREIDYAVRTNIIPFIVIILVIFIFLTLFMYFVIRRRVLLPAKKISSSMTDFIRDGKRSGEKLDESGSDEFALIASSFNKMNDEIDTYLENIKNLSTAQERQHAELDIASRIQQDLLSPNEFHTDDCEIFAMMRAARNVGGDLYDYYMLDDGRVYFVIADVSGKGIAASLYMAVTLMVMRQTAISGKNPADILKETNNILSTKNENLFFTTAFVGIYNPENRVLIYSNAGHNPTYILRDKPEVLSGAKNIVLGLYKDEPYTEDKIILEAGDILFMYTDGVTDAINGKKEFFGDGRLKETLDKFRPSHEENIVRFVSRTLKDFAGDAEQHDDITMLSLTMKQHTELELAPEKKEFSKIKQVILDSRLEHSLKLSLCVAAEEIYINICSYAFESQAPENEKRITFTFEHSDRIFMRFEDNGSEYDPTKSVDFGIDYNLDEQLGGLGKIIAFTIADSVNYEYTGNKNILTITKYLLEDKNDNNTDK